MYSVDELVDRLIDLAFAEDIGDGDHTTLCCIPEDAMGAQKLLVKEDGIIAGIEVAKKIFHRFDPDLQMEQLMNDGDSVKVGDVAFVVRGKVRSLLQTERLMLNVMQRMSGIATMTARYMKQLEGTKCIYHQYTIEVPNRDAVHKYLQEKGVGAMLYYPVPLHLQKVHRNLGGKLGDLPVTEEKTTRVMSLPMFPEITEEQQRTVVNTLVEALEACKAGV